MRAIHVVVIRLFVDSDQPGAVRGAAQPIPDGLSRTFGNEEALLTLLRQWATPAKAETSPDEPVAAPERIP